MAKLCFQIHGDHLTEISRSRVLEDRWDHGYKILHEGLHGISIDQVLTILKGDAKLTGVNTVDLEPDDATEYKALLAYRFAGVWVTGGGRMLRPYAIVTSWGPDDMRQAARITRDSDSVWNQKMGGEMSGRDLFYANDPTRDAVKQMKLPKDMDSFTPLSKAGTVAVLWHEVHNHPSMIWAPLSDAQAALAQYLEHHGLPERGYAQTFPADRFKLRYEVQSKDEPVPNAYTQSDYGTGNLSNEQALGAAKAKAIDAKAAGMTVAEYDDYQSLMRGETSPTAQLDRMLDAQRRAKTAIPEWRALILEQAQEAGFIPFTYENVTYQIPRAPFENWCLWRTDGAHLAPAWGPICPQGLKMMGDDTYHTDWMVGAGFEVDAMITDRELNDAVFKLHFETQRRLLGFEAAVLSGQGTAYGTGRHWQEGLKVDDDTILILPSANPKYLPAALLAKAVITQQGGAMAHLVNVAREADKIIVRVPDALTRYPDGSSIIVDATKGKVELQQGDMKSIWDMTRG